MTDQIELHALLRVCVYAPDVITRSGIVAELERVDDIRIDAEPVDAAVAIVVADDVGDETCRLIRNLRRTQHLRVVCIVTRVDDRALFAVAEAGACGILRKKDIRGDALVRTLRQAAAGDGTLPPDLLGRLLEHVGRLQQHVLNPQGLHFSGLRDREIEVLRLVADGYDTAEIARQLAYSERTIKNILHDLTSRLGLKNRSQAVAFAARAGLI